MWWFLFVIVFVAAAGIVGFSFWIVVGGCFADDETDKPERRNYD